MNPHRLDGLITLDELEDTLPNGLHDAKMASVRIDYVRREVEIELELSVGLPDDGPGACDAYRWATLTFSGLNYFCIEPPDSHAHFRIAGPLMVDTWPVESLYRSPEPQLPDVNRSPVPRLPDAIPGDGFVGKIYINDWNSFMYVSAQSASLAWHDEREPG